MLILAAFAYKTLIWEGFTLKNERDNTLGALSTAFGRNYQESRPANYVKVLKAFPLCDSIL